MRKETTVIAKTLEEALQKAVEELGAPSVDELEYEVLEEAKKGLFGIGATPAKIRASYRKSGVTLALEFLTRLTADMGLNVTMEVRDGTNDDKVIAIDGDNAGILIGHHIGLFRSETGHDLRQLRQYALAGQDLVDLRGMGLSAETACLLNVLLHKQTPLQMGVAISFMIW